MRQEHAGTGLLKPVTGSLLLLKWTTLPRNHLDRMVKICHPNEKYRGVKIKRMCENKSESWLNIRLWSRFYLEGKWKIFSPERDKDRIYGVVSSSYLHLLLPPTSGSSEASLCPDWPLEDFTHTLLAELYIWTKLAVVIIEGVILFSQSVCVWKAEELFVIFLSTI